MSNKDKESFAGVPRIVVSCFNPSWEDSDGDDTWYGILPDSEGKPTIINLGLHGYTPKEVLRETALYFLLNRDSIEANRVEDYPIVSNLDSLKKIGFALPILA